MMFEDFRVLHLEHFPKIPGCQGFRKIYQQLDTILGDIWVRRGEGGDPVDV